MSGGLFEGRELTPKDEDILLTFYAYSGGGETSLTVRELYDAFQETLRDEPDWEWRNYSMGLLGDRLRFFEARSFVLSDGGNPAKWSLTSLGIAYHEADDPAVRRCIFAVGWEWYVGRIDPSSPDHHSSAREALNRRWREASGE